MKKCFNRMFRRPLVFSVFVMIAFLFMSNLFYTILYGMENTLLRYTIRAAVEITLAAAAALALKKRIGRGFTLGITGDRLGMALMLLSSFYISCLFNACSILAALTELDPNATGSQILLGVATGFMGGLRPGVVEELVCRVCIMGYLAYMWAEKPDGLRKAVWASAILFGLAHMNNVVDNGLVNTLFQCMYATAIGGLFGAVYARTHNLLSLMVAHIIVDSLSFIAMDLPTVEKAAEAATTAPDTAGLIVYLALSLIWGGTAIYLLRKKKLAEAEKLWQPEALPAAQEPEMAAAA